MKAIVITAVLALAFTTGFTCSKNQPEATAPEATPAATAPTGTEMQPAATAPTGAEATTGTTAATGAEAATAPTGH